MTKSNVLLTVSEGLSDLTEEALHLLKRLVGDDFTGPAAEANRQRYAKFCREALTLRDDWPRGLQAELDEAAAEIVPSWGGPRPGAGRKPSGRKRYQFYVTEEENALLRSYLEQLRKSGES